MQVAVIIKGTTPHLGTFPSSFARFTAKSLQISSILMKFAIKLRISREKVLSSFASTYLLKICKLRNFLICRYLEI